MKMNVYKPSAGNSEDFPFLELLVTFLLTVKIFQSDILLNLSATWNSMQCKCFGGHFQEEGKIKSVMFEECTSPLLSVSSQTPILN